ncbi:MAG: hypothetical protein WAM30_07910 [Candidatus Dormiibacterota bacterium]
MATQETPQSSPGGVIHDVAVLDLTASHSPDELRHITRIEDVAVVLVRESAASALNAIDMNDVASVVVVPGEGAARVHTGTYVTTGEGLAEEGVEHDMLVVTGTMLVTTPVRHVALQGIVVTGRVIAPQGSETALATGLTRITGSVDYFPFREGQRIELRAGSAELRGQALANQGGSASDLLLVSGALTITGDVPTVGYECIVVTGSLAAPAAAQDVLEPVVHASSTLWYTGKPMRFNGKQTFSRGFFELLDEPVTLLLNGSFEIDDDVPLELAKTAVAGVALNGRLTASKALASLFQVRALAVNGEVVDRDAAREGVAALPEP